MVVRHGLVSTIIPVHNRCALVRKAIESVLEQDWRSIEIVVVDDGSTDDTPRELSCWAQRHPGLLRVVTRRAPGGPGVAREAGRAVAQGEFIQYLDSDDWLLPGKFRAQVELMRRRPEVALVYGDVQESAEGHASSDVTTRDLPRLENVFPDLLVRRTWHTFAPLYRRSVLDQVGPWLPLWAEEDWEHDARVGALGLPIAHIAGPVGVMRRHRDGHLSGTPRHRRRTLRHQAIARSRIVAHALRAGVRRDAPEMQSAVRALFLLSRQCGAVGLAADARRLFIMARDLSTSPDTLDWRGYATISRWCGWRAAGVAAAWRDRLRGAWA